MSECREAFEAWYSEDGKYPRAVEKNADGEYILMQAASSWRAFQAGWNARPGVTVPVEVVDEALSVVSLMVDLKDAKDAGLADNEFYQTYRPQAWHRMRDLLGKLRTLKGGGDAD